jgi:hypothetical protein
MVAGPSTMMLAVRPALMIAELWPGVLLSRKLSTAAQAREFYVSSWFMAVRRYVEAAGDPWYVLSAKYALVTPAQVLAPYDETLNPTIAGSGRRRAPLGWQARYVCRDKARPAVSLSARMWSRSELPSVPSVPPIQSTII